MDKEESVLDREALLAHDEAGKEEGEKKVDNKSNSRALIIGFAAMCVAVSVLRRAKVRWGAPNSAPAPCHAGVFCRVWGTKCSGSCS